MGIWLLVLAKVRNSRTLNAVIYVVRRQEIPKKILKIVLSALHISVYFYPYSSNSFDNILNKWGFLNQIAINIKIFLKYLDKFTVKIFEKFVFWFITNWLLNPICFSSYIGLS